MAMNHLPGRMFVFLGAVAYCLPLSALAQDQFFRGKSLRIVVGFAAGGGFDTIRAPSRVIGAGTFPATRRSSWKIWAGREA